MGNDRDARMSDPPKPKRGRKKHRVEDDSILTAGGRQTDPVDKVYLNGEESTDIRPAHYKTGSDGKQHWDRAWEQYREAWFVLNITKYVERYRDKEGLKDLYKARTYLDKLISLEEAEYDTK